MKMLFVFLVALSVSLSVFSSPRSLPVLKFTYNTSFTTHLWYVIDALSGNTLFSTSSEAYQEYWARNFQFGKKEEVLLNDYYEIMWSYKKVLVPHSTANVKSLIPLPWKERTQRDLLREILMSGRNEDEIFYELGTFIKDKDLVRLKVIYDHFKMNMKKVWLDAKYLEEIKKEAKKFIEQDSFKKLLQEAISFYGANLGKKWNFQMNFIWRPKASLESDSAQVFEVFTNVEMIEGYQFMQNMDVVFHEMCHVFWDARSKRSQGQLIDDHFKTGSGHSGMAYRTLNEALASVWGAGIFNRRFRSKVFKELLNRENGFYNDYYIDNYAKVLLPLVDKYNAKKMSLLEDFASQAIQAFEKKFVAEKVLMKSRVDNSLRMYSKSAYKIGRSVFRKNRVDGWSYSSLLDVDGLKLLKKHPAFNVILVATKEDTSELKGLFEKKVFSEGIKSKISFGKSFIYYKKGKYGAYRFLLFSGERKDVAQVISSFLQTKTVLKDEGYLF